MISNPENPLSSRQSDKTLSGLLKQNCFRSAQKHPHKQATGTGRDRIHSLSRNYRVNPQFSPKEQKLAKSAKNNRLSVDGLAEHVEQLKDPADLEMLRHRIDELLKTHSKTRVGGRSILSGSPAKSNTPAVRTLWPFW